MLTSVQLYRHDKKLTACALSEPSLTLVRNDTQFGLLISEGAHESAGDHRFHLDQVSFLCVSGRHWSYTEFESVIIFHRNGIWLAQDPASAGYFPNPSHLPYHVVFISPEKYARFRYARAEGLAFPVFELAQQCFGRLPGFTFGGASLESPNEYANLNDALPLSDYVPTA